MNECWLSNIYGDERASTTFMRWTACGMYLGDITVLANVYIRARALDLKAASLIIPAAEPAYDAPINHALMRACHLISPPRWQLAEAAEKHLDRARVFCRPGSVIKRQLACRETAAVGGGGGGRATTEGGIS